MSRQNTFKYPGILSWSPQNTLEYQGIHSLSTQNTFPRGACAEHKRFVRMYMIYMSSARRLRQAQTFCQNVYGLQNPSYGSRRINEVLNSGPDTQYNMQ